MTSILDHFGVTIPAEPLLPITPQFSRTPVGTHVSQSGPLLLSMTESRIGNDDHGASTPSNSKVLRYSAGPLGSTALSVSTKSEPASTVSELLPASAATGNKRGQDQQGASAVTVQKVLQLLADHTTTEADYHIDIYEKASLLPILEEAAEKARRAYNDDANRYLSRGYVQDTSAVKLQLETINAKERKAAEERKQQMQQEEMDIHNMLNEIYLHNAVEQAAEQGKRQRYINDVEAFRREEEEIKAAKLAAERQERGEENRKAHEYFSEARMRSAKELERRRLEAKRNQAFVDALIENKKMARKQEKTADGFVGSYAGPEDNTAALQLHEEQTRAFLKAAADEATQARERKMREERAQRERELEEARAIRSEIEQAQQAYMESKAKEAEALKRTYEQDMTIKREAAQREKALTIKQEVDAETKRAKEQQQAKDKQEAADKQQRAWLQANIKDGLKEKAINAKFNMLLAKIKEYESRVSLGPQRTHRPD